MLSGLCTVTIVPLLITLYMPNVARNVLKTYIQVAIFGNGTLNSKDEHSMVYVWSVYTSLGAIGALFRGRSRITSSLFEKCYLGACVPKKAHFAVMMIQTT